MTAYLYNFPSGVVGDITRPDETAVEPALLVAPMPAGFGVAMKYVPGGITPMVSGDAAGVFAGFLARSAPGISGSSSNEAIGTFLPNTNEIHNLVTRGYLAVQCNSGVPVRGQPVYIVETASTGHVVGQFETSANGGNNIALSGTVVGNVTWATDGVDANGLAEIRIAQ